MFHAAWPALLDDVDGVNEARDRHLAASVVVLGLSEPERFAPGALSARLFGDALPLERRLEIAGAMAGVPVEPTALLVARLHAADASERAVAARALGAPAHASACATLRRAARDLDARVRVAALQALAALGDERASASAVAALADDEAAVRRAAVAALAALSGGAARVALARAATDPDVDVRCAALAALVVLGGLEARVAGKGALTDRAPEVRALAVQVLARLGHHDDMAGLENDPDARVQRAVKEARVRALA